MSGYVPTYLFFAEDHAKSRQNNCRLCGAKDIQVWATNDTIGKILSVPTVDSIDTMWICGHCDRESVRQAWASHI